MRKATSITKDNNIANLSIWHMRGYEELISNRIASLAYLGLMTHYMILYTPQIMHHLNLTHHSKKDVTPRKLQETRDLQIKRFVPQSNQQGLRTR